MKNNKKLVIELVLDRLALYMKYDGSELKAKSPIELVQMGLVDPVRVFIKNEPHKRDKIQTGRYRLISSVSMVDEIIERILFQKQDTVEILNCATIPSKPGIGFSQDEQIRSLIKHVREMVEKVGKDYDLVEDDMTGWDFSVKYWMLIADFRARCLLNKTEWKPGNLWAHCARTRITCMAYSVFVTSDGEMYAQGARGIMKSGSKITSSTNSRVHFIVAHICGAALGMEQGDDGLNMYKKGEVEKVRELYREMGLKPKLFKISSPDDFEFCSYRFTGGVAEPLNWAKTTYRFLCNKVEPDAEICVQFKHELRHSPHYLTAKRLVLQVWPGLAKFL